MATTYADGPSKGEPYRCLWCGRDTLTCTADVEVSGDRLRLFVCDYCGASMHVEAPRKEEGE